MHLLEYLLGAREQQIRIPFLLELFWIGQYLLLKDCY